VVFPDANGHQGHIGIIVSATNVIHCSSGNNKQFGNAIQSTPLTVFSNNPKTRFGWLHGCNRPAHGPNKPMRGAQREC